MANKDKAGSKGGNFDKFKGRANPKADKKNDRKREKEQRRRERRAQKSEVAGTSRFMNDGPIRLNRYIALSGVCSRREADELIAQGKIRVNGTVTKELGLKVTPGKDSVHHGKQLLQIKRFVYLLMNKPKNHITTVKDDLGRKTVMEIVERYTKARVYPVGRLDRNTTGLLLFTNDGDLAKQLTHPSHEIPKLYQVQLDREVEAEHLAAFRKGIELEDGTIKADKATYIEGSPTLVAVQLHSGRNRIVRRMFEHFGYKIVSLDRVGLGSLTKKALPRGTCRLLTDKEVGFLRMESKRSPGSK